MANQHLAWISHLPAYLFSAQNIKGMAEFKQVDEEVDREMAESEGVADCLHLKG